MIRILFIDDDVKLQKLFKMLLSEEYHFTSAFTGNQGVVKIKEEDPDVVLLDINLPDKDGITVLKEIKALPAAPPVIMVTAMQEIGLVVRAIQAGAFDYIIKSPQQDIKHLKGVIHNAAQNTHRRFVSTENKLELDNIIGESYAVKTVKELINCYAGSDSPVLITGESGTGKELVASAIHKLSHRNKNPFLPVNCGAIPNTLIETTLFGSEKGAFTDALSAPGYFEKADSGTIFLDEIGEMYKESQVKLLRVLETREIERVGGRSRFFVNVRIIAATNRNLKDEIAAGRFREDLYYRLNVLLITVPGLRERKEDIPILASYFLTKQFKSAKTLGSSAIEKLLEHPYPGNIRELRNVVERAVLIAKNDTISAENIIFT